MCAVLCCVGDFFLFLVWYSNRTWWRPFTIEDRNLCFQSALKVHSVFSTMKFQFFWFFFLLRFTSVVSNKKIGNLSDFNNIVGKWKRNCSTFITHSFTRFFALPKNSDRNSLWALRIFPDCFSMQRWKEVEIPFQCPIFYSFIFNLTNLSNPIRKRIIILRRETIEATSWIFIWCNCNERNIFQ